MLNRAVALIVIVSLCVVLPALVYLIAHQIFCLLILLLISVSAIRWNHIQQADLLVDQVSKEKEGKADVHDWDHSCKDHAHIGIVNVHLHQDYGENQSWQGTADANENPE